MKSEPSVIGSELLEHSRKTKFTAQRGVIEMLFPYIYQASKRMSTRAIRDWLEDKHGIQISAVTIAKALRNAPDYWSRFHAYIDFSACEFAAAHEVKVEEVLFDRKRFEALKKQPVTLWCKNPDDREEKMQRAVSYQISTQVLERDWFGLDDATIAELKPILEAIIALDRKKWEASRAKATGKGTKG